MKISKKQLRRIIREEYTRLRIRKMLNETKTPDNHLGFHGDRLTGLKVYVADNEYADPAVEYVAEFANGYKNDRKEKGSSGQQSYIMAAQDMAEAHSKPSKADPDIMFNKSRFTSAIDNFCAQWALYLKSSEGVDVSAADLKALYKAGKVKVKFSYFEPVPRRNLDNLYDPDGKAFAFKR